MQHRQISMFDLVRNYEHHGPPSNEIRVDDEVRVIAKAQRNMKKAKAIDIEDYYYHKQFEGLTGRVIKALHDKDQYTVEFKRRKWPGIFRKSEIEKVTE